MIKPTPVTVDFSVPFLVVIKSQIILRLKYNRIGLFLVQYHLMSLWTSWSSLLCTAAV